MLAWQLSNVTHLWLQGPNTTLFLLVGASRAILCIRLLGLHGLHYIRGFLWWVQACCWLRLVCSALTFKVPCLTATIVVCFLLQLGVWYQLCRVSVLVPDNSKLACLLQSKISWGLHCSASWAINWRLCKYKREQGTAAYPQDRVTGS